MTTSLGFQSGICCRRKVVQSRMRGSESSRVQAFWS